MTSPIIDGLVYQFFNFPSSKSSITKAFFAKSLSRICRIHLMECSFFNFFKHLMKPKKGRVRIGLNCEITKKFTSSLLHSKSCNGHCKVWQQLQQVDQLKLMFQKQSLRGVLSKRCSENMYQIYRRTPMPKCDFNEVAKQLY